MIQKREHKFLTTLSMSPMSDGVSQRLNQPFSFLATGGTLITVPTSFVTDLASIPHVQWIGAALQVFAFLLEALRCGRWTLGISSLGLLFIILSPYLQHAGKYTKAAVVHDWLYRTRALPRWHADWLFLEMMKLLKVSAWQRWIIFLNVRAFGWIAWRNEKRWVNARDYSA